MSVVFGALARLADGHAKAVVAVTVVFFVVAAYFGGNVAEYMGPYGDEDPATESVRAERALEGAGFRAATILAAARFSYSGPATEVPPNFITTTSPSAPFSIFSSTFATGSG